MTVEAKMKILMFLILSLLMASAAVSQDWPMTNYDHAMSRHSPQMVIGPNNVNQLQVKWILGANNSIENPPLIVGTMGYTQSNEQMEVIAFDLNTGLSKWTYSPNFASANSGGRAPHGVQPGGTPHGMTYENGVIYAATGNLGTVVALNASTGQKIWESEALQQIGGETLFQTVAPPLVWNNLVIEGSSGGDVPPPGIPARGMIVALDINTGKIVWQTKTAVGAWVESNNSSINTSLNGGADPWSGGAIDTEKGVAYIPCGNAAPDFDASSRPEPNLYVNNVIAVNLTDGKILWNSPFMAEGTFLKNVSLPDLHDWDPSFGTSLATVNVNGTQQKIVIAHDKRGDIAALNTTTGKPIWWMTLGIVYRDFAKPAPNGSGVVWPGTQNGVEAYVANDNNTVYAAVSNTGVIYYTDEKNHTGHVVPAFSAMPNGIGNGSIVAIDIKTGNIKWEHKTDFPTWCSPLVTNGLVFSGHITATGKPYPYNDFAAATGSTPQMPSGIIMALDANTGQTLWEFNVGAPLGIAGPSIGNGFLLVPTGAPDEVNANIGGWIVAFGLPSATAGGQNANATLSTTGIQV
jgi:alcohol dehydrogenase (cytochrome c)